MLIDTDNCQVGNAGIASVLLLYYHLLRDHGVTHGQTVYIDPAVFDPLKFLSVRVSSDSLDIDEALLREGAMVQIICDINDMINENEENYLSLDFVKKRLHQLEEVKGEFPKLSLLLDQIKLPLETREEYSIYREVLDAVYNEYVVK